MEMSKNRGFGKDPLQVLYPVKWLAYSRKGMYKCNLCPISAPKDISYERINSENILKVTKAGNIYPMYTYLDRFLLPGPNSD